MTRSRLRPGYSVQSSRSRMVTTGGLSGPYVNPLLPRSRLGTEYYSPTLSKAQYDSTAFDYTIDNAMSRSSYLSSAAIDDFYDTSAKSRGKDRRLLDDTTTAIVSTETHSSPRNAVTIRRATRGRTPVGGAGGVRSSMQVKTASLSSSYPSASQVAAPARPQPASTAPSVIRVRVRGIPGMIIVPKARAPLGARSATKWASPARPLAPVELKEPWDDRPPSADDVRVVAASYRSASLAPRPRRALGGRAPASGPLSADIAHMEAQTLVAQALGLGWPRVRLVDLSYRRVGLPPRFRKHAVLYTAGRSLALPKRYAASVKGSRLRPPSRKSPQVLAKSVYARALRAVLFGEPMPAAEDAAVPDMSYVARLFHLPIPMAMKSKLASSLTPAALLFPHPLFPIIPRDSLKFHPAFPLIFRRLLPLPYPQTASPSSAALAMLLRLREMQTSPPLPPQRYRKAKTSSARVRPKYRSKSKKAAIVASKLEMDEPRRRRPRSKFAADKLRSVRLESLESQGRANYPVSQLQSTFGLRASKPPLRRH